jgi:alkylation response protein AidB-like acyl-CoA dehydrogenase
VNGDNVRDEIAQTAHRFLRARWPVTPSASLERPTTDKLRSFWRSLCELGWQWIIASKDKGACLTAAPLVEALFRELGGNPVPVPAVEMFVAVPVLYAEGGDQARKALEPLLEGTAASIAILSEDDGGSLCMDPWAAIQIADGRATGSKTLVSFGRSVPAVIVTGHRNGTPCIALLDVDEAAEIEDLDSVDRLEQPALLRFAGAPVTMLFEGKDALASMAVIETLSRLAVSAELLGASQTGADMTVAYAKDRMQFGRPIGSFQAIKHLIADSALELYGLESAVEHAARLIAARTTAGEAEKAATLVRAFASPAARKVLEMSLQVHGGIGFTAENPLSWYFNRGVSRWAAWGDPAELALAVGRAEVRTSHDARTADPPA